MVSGPVVVQVLEGDNAIAKYRELMGATDPAKAAPGTIRKVHAQSIERKFRARIRRPRHRGARDRAVLFGERNRELGALVRIGGPGCIHSRRCWIRLHGWPWSCSGWSDLGQTEFWVALVKIMWINVLLSGDNARGDRHGLPRPAAPSSGSGA